jgi:hypothetical protein
MKDVTLRRDADGLIHVKSSGSQGFFFAVCEPYLSHDVRLMGQTTYVDADDEVITCLSCLVYMAYRGQ